MKITIINNNQRFGYSVGEASIAQTIKQADITCKCMQLYHGGMTSYGSPKIDSGDFQYVNNVYKLLNQTVYIHCPLISNLALPDDNKITIGSYRGVKDRLNITQQIPTSCVLHIGKRGKNYQGTIEQVGINVNKLMADLKVCSVLPLLMENAAGQQGELGHSINDLRHLFESIDKSKVGLCIDTQHSYASGLCEFQTHEEVCKLFDDITSIGKIQLFHLNDSMKEYNSRVDRHQALTKGYIWYKNQEGLHSVIQHCFDDSIDMVSETNNPIADLQLIRDYIDSQT